MGIWIRTSDRYKLLECNKLLVDTYIDYETLDKVLNEKLATEIRPIKWLESDGKEIILTTAEWLTRKEDSIKEKYRWWAVKNEHEYLGTYATKERALQVLDEIQKAIINGHSTFTLNDETRTYGIFYEMPKE